MGTSYMLHLQKMRSKDRYERDSPPHESELQSQEVLGA